MKLPKKTSKLNTSHHPNTRQAGSQSLSQPANATTAANRLLPLATMDRHSFVADQAVPPGLLAKS